MANETDQIQLWTREYLRYALSFSDKEEEIKSEINSWLPKNIIDCHAHANDKTSLLYITTETLNRHSSFPVFEITDSLLVSQTFYSGKNIHSLRFAMPYKGINHRRANSYLVNNSPKNDLVALYGLPDDIPYTVNEIVAGRYAALKMYPYYFDPPSHAVLGFFPKEVLKVAESADLPIILHLPSPLSCSATEVTDIAKEFPNLKIILAYLGTRV